MILAFDVLVPFITYLFMILIAVLITQDPTKSLFLIGSHGTGKTLALVAALKRKVAYYKRLKKPIKVLVLTYRENKNLLQDLKNKYGLQSILDEYETEPISLEQVKNGILKGKSIFTVQ